MRSHSHSMPAGSLPHSMRQIANFPRVVLLQRTRARVVSVLVCVCVCVVGAPCQNENIQTVCCITPYFGSPAFSMQIESFLLCVRCVFESTQKCRVYRRR